MNNAVQDISIQLTNDPTSVTLVNMDLNIEVRAFQHISLSFWFESDLDNMFSLHLMIINNRKMEDTKVKNRNEHRRIMNLFDI